MIVLGRQTQLFSSTSLSDVSLSCSIGNILLVEDKQSYIDLILEALENCQNDRKKYNLYSVKNGEEALNFLYRKENYALSPRPDLILLDLNLPKINGFEILSIIKQDSQLGEIPVIILTTSTEPKDIVESYKRNANCYINKPFDIDRLFIIIERIVDFWLDRPKECLSINNQ